MVLGLVVLEVVLLVVLGLVVLEVVLLGLVVLGVVVLLLVLVVLGLVVHGVVVLLGCVVLGLVVHGVVVLLGCVVLLLVVLGEVSTVSTVVVGHVVVVVVLVRGLLVHRLGLLNHGGHVATDHAATDNCGISGEEGHGATDERLLTGEVLQDHIVAFELGGEICGVSDGSGSREHESASGGVLEWVGVSVLISLEKRVELGTSVSLIAGGSKFTLGVELNGEYITFRISGNESSSPDGVLGELSKLKV